MNYCTAEYQDYEKIICLCYDYDVFRDEHGPKPPINREKVESQLHQLGADKIIKIIANPCIEDFFLIDLESIRKYLRLPESKVPKNRQSLELLKSMYEQTGLM